MDPRDSCDAIFSGIQQFIDLKKKNNDFHEVKMTIEIVIFDDMIKIEFDDWAREKNFKFLEFEGNFSFMF